jgi:hypothetical protein
LPHQNRYTTANICTLAAHGFSRINSYPAPNGVGAAGANNQLVTAPLDGSPLVVKAAFASGYGSA